MFDDPKVMAIFLGMMYLFVWSAYRYVRYLRHTKLLSEHQQERLSRTKWKHERKAYLRKLKSDSSCNKDNINIHPFHDKEREEAIRQAEWDGKFGPLSAAINLKDREETRWAVGNAFQGAVGVYVGLTVASYIWGMNGGKGGGGDLPSPVVRPPIVVEPMTGQQYQETILVVVGTLTIILCAILLSVLAKSNKAKVLSMSLLFVAPLISTGKLLSVEIKNVIGQLSVSLGWIGNKPGPSNPSPYSPPPNPNPYPEPPKINYTTTKSISEILPPFNSGSAELTGEIIAKIDDISLVLSLNKPPNIIVIVGRADRRELKPNTKAKYASNWGLAQQRAKAIKSALISRGIPNDKLLITTAGPLNTSDPTPGQLGRDRSASLFVRIGEIPLVDVK